MRRACAALCALGTLAGLAGCHSAPVAITFSAVPEVSRGGENTSGIVSGHVTGARSGDHIVIYVRPTNRWWVQPFANRPLTAIRPDGSWSTSTHLGLEFAALLVSGKYEAAPVIDSLPPVGGRVRAVARIPATAVSAKDAALLQENAAPRIVSFSGYDWLVMNGVNHNGGQMHRYDPENVWVDDRGALHLAMRRVGKEWECAEASTLRSLGNGSYRFRLRDIGHFEPATMLTLSNLRDTSEEAGSREMDIHISRWGVPGNKNGEFVMQPYYLPSNVYRFEVPPGPVTASFRWSTDSVLFSTEREGRTHPSTLSSWTFTTDIPTAGDEHTHVSLCVFPYSPAPQQKDMEVVIDQFQFLP